MHVQILTAKLQQDISFDSPSLKHSVAVKSSPLGIAWGALVTLQEDRAALAWLSSELLAKLFIPLLVSEQAASVTDNATEGHAEELRVLAVSEDSQAGSGGRESGLLQCFEFLQGQYTWSCTLNLVQENVSTNCLKANENEALFARAGFWVTSIPRGISYICEAREDKSAIMCSSKEMVYIIVSSSHSCLRPSALAVWLQRW